MPKQLWPWSPNTVTITQKSTGSASPHWTAFRGPTNRPHGHTHEEAHFWQNMARKQGGWAGADEVIRREEKRRNRATRAAEHTGKENPTHPGKTVTLSVAMASSSFYHQGLVRTFPPVPREIPASEWLLPAHKDFPPLPSPQCSLWGHLQGRSESWAGIIEPHPRQFRNEALQPVAEGETGLGSLESFHQHPSSLCYIIFPSLNFMCNQQSRQEKQAKSYIHRKMLICLFY